MDAPKKKPKQEVKEEKDEKESVTDWAAFPEYSGDWVFDLDEYITMCALHLERDSAIRLATNDFRFRFLLDFHN